MYSRFRQTKCLRYRAQFKQIRNKVNQYIRNAKLRYAHSLFEKRKSSRELWQNLKKLNVVNKPKAAPRGPSPEALNAHFSNVQEVFPDGVRDSIAFYDSLRSPDRESFHFKHVTPEMVGRAVADLGSNAKGIDNIPAVFIKNCITELTPAMVHIFNHCLQYGQFPDVWKQAVVKPIPKKSNGTDPKDYRPISLLCVLSKILEKIVHDQVLKYLNQHSVLNIYQSGFKKSHSTNTALLQVSGDL